MQILAICINMCKLLAWCCAMQALGSEMRVLGSDMRAKCSQMPAPLQQYADNVLHQIVEAESFCLQVRCPLYSLAITKRIIFILFSSAHLYA